MVALSQGKINFIAECSPLLGPQLMDLVKKVVAGRPFPSGSSPSRRRSPRPRPRPLSRAGSTSDRTTTLPGAELRSWPPAASRRRLHADDAARHRCSRCAGSRSVRRRQGSRRRRFPAVPGRSPCADGRERRRQVHADEGAHRRVRARRGRRSSWTGSAVAVRAARCDAQRAGISTVYQEVNLCPNLSVAENIFDRARAAPARPHPVARRAAPRDRGARARQPRPSTSRRQLGGYSLAVQQMVAIARAIDISAAGADPRRADLEPRRRGGRSSSSR